MTKYVIFNSQSEFDSAHAAAKEAAGMPRVGCINGNPAPQNQQTTEITSSAPHPSDGTVVAYINGGWPEDLKVGFTFKTKEEVSEYFPNEEI